MLTISSKCKYGILAVLSLAENHDQGLLQIKDIANKNSIPPQYLGQIFNLLVKSDIVSSVRGKNGGYRLSRSPSRVTVLEIIETLEGEIAFSDKTPATTDAIHELFSSAEAELRKAFKVSLSDLLSRQKEKNNALVYNI